MEYYSAIIKNEVVPSASTGMQLEIIILSEVKIEKDKYHMLSHMLSHVMCGIQNMAQMNFICATEIQTPDIENRHVVTREVGVGEERTGSLELSVTLYL